MKRRSNETGYMLSKVLKSRKLGKPHFYKTYGNETVEDVINRLESYNIGTKFVEA